LSAQSSTTLRRFASIAASSLLLSASIGLQSCATDQTVQTTASEQTNMSDARRAEHIESFEYIWNSVKNNHWDPDLNGVDWDQARADLLPKIENAQTDNEARVAMNQLLERLEQSHFGIIPSSAYDQLEEESAEIIDEEVESTDSESSEDDSSDSGPGQAGMNIRLINDQFLVTNVKPGSAADRAGVKTGWIVESIRGREMQSLVKVVHDMGGINRPETQAGLIAYSRIQGDAGDKLRMTFSDDLDEPREITLTLDKAPGEMAGIGALPERPIEYEATTLNNGVGYFRLNMFMNPGKVLPAYQKFVKDHMDAPGIIIDMRGNFGGIILMAPGMINWLVSEKGLTMGTMKMRDPARGPFDIPLMLNPRKNSYKGKVAVLTDELSISNAEILAAGLKDIGRAQVFGQRTAGLVLPSTVERLPNGDGFQYAFASYSTGGGYTLEGQGAIPDHEIQYTRQALLNGHDEILEAAEDWIVNND
jgi:carboxyl-terminal processing protease